MMSVSRAEQRPDTIPTTFYGLFFTYSQVSKKFDGVSYAITSPGGKSTVLWKKRLVVCNPTVRQRRHRRTWTSHWCVTVYPVIGSVDGANSFSCTCLSPDQKLYVSVTEHRSLFTVIFGLPRKGDFNRCDCRPHETYGFIWNCEHRRLLNRGDVPFQGRHDCRCTFVCKNGTKRNIFTFMWPCIVTNFILIKPTDALISQIYFCQEILHVSGSSSAHHQEFSTAHSALVYVIKLAWHIPVPNVQWKTSDDGHRNCPKHVEFLDKNKSGKLVQLLVLFKINKEIYVGRGRRSDTPSILALWNKCCLLLSVRSCANMLAIFT